MHFNRSSRSSMRSRLTTAGASARWALFGALVVVLILGGVEVARARDADPPTATIRACYAAVPDVAPKRGDDRKGDDKRGDERNDDQSGALRIVRSASDCRRNETFIQWGQVGPKGATGPTGPQGPAGTGGTGGPPR